MRRAIVPLALSLIALAAEAKTIVYPIEPDILAKPAAEIGLAPSPAPVPGTRDLTLTVAPAADHEVTRVGILGGGGRLDNPISTLMQSLLTARDADGRLDNRSGAPVLGIAIDRAATLSRCVNVAELKGMCIVRSTIEGSATPDGGSRHAIRVELERSFQAVMISHGVALISREAALQFLAQAEAAAS